MTRHTALTPLALAMVIASSLGCASLGLPKPELPTLAAGDPSQPGTPAWWSKHKKKAVFEPGGYRVEGYDGLFDEQGRPINARVAKVVDKPKGGGLLGDPGFDRAVNDFKETMGLGPDQQQAKLDFEVAEAHFRAARYDEAAKYFKKAAKSWPQSTLEQDALFQLGESYFFGERYVKANDAFEQLIRDYPNSPHLDKIVTRQFAVARYWEQYAEYDPDWVTTPNLVNKRLPLFDTLGRAIKVYENIRINDPTGPLADDAIMATANSYFIRGRYNDADYHYDLLRKEYPRSDHQYNAHLLGLQCKLRRYQGPDYDGTPLEEAEQLVKQQRTQFVAELSEPERQELARIEAQIKRELATREFAMAEHFDNLKEFGSAKFYYAQVARNYPGVELADKARERIAALGGEPDRPEPKLSWIINRLPESAERTAVAQVPLLDGSGGTRLAEGGEATTAERGNVANDPAVRR